MSYSAKVFRQLLIFEVAVALTHTHTNKNLTKSTDFADILGSFHLFNSLVQAHTSISLAANTPLL